MTKVRHKQMLQCTLVIKCDFFFILDRCDFTFFCAKNFISKDVCTFGLFSIDASGWFDV